MRISELEAKVASMEKVRMTLEEKLTLVTGNAGLLKT
jgi:exonuclease VII small subunit